MLEDEICSQLKMKLDSSENIDVMVAAKSSINLNLTSLSTPVVFEKITLAPCQEDPAGEESGVICNREVTIKYNPSMETLHNLSSSESGSALELDFEKGALTVDVGHRVQPAEEAESGAEDEES